MGVTVAVRTERERRLIHSVLPSGKLFCFVPFKHIVPVQKKHNHNQRQWRFYPSLISL